MERIFEILKKQRPGYEFKDNTLLLNEGVLDSFGIMNLAVEIEEEYEIEFTPFDIIPENFNTPKDIWNLIKRKLEGE